MATDAIPVPIDRKRKAEVETSEGSSPEKKEKETPSRCDLCLAESVEMVGHCHLCGNDICQNCVAVKEKIGCPVCISCFAEWVRLRDVGVTRRLAKIADAKAAAATRPPTGANTWLDLPVDFPPYVADFVGRTLKVIKKPNGGGVSHLACTTSMSYVCKTWSSELKYWMDNPTRVTITNHQQAGVDITEVEKLYTQWLERYPSDLQDKIVCDLRGYSGSTTIKYKWLGLLAPAIRYAMKRLSVSDMLSFDPSSEKTLMVMAGVWPGYLNSPELRDAVASYAEATGMHLSPAVPTLNRAAAAPFTEFLMYLAAGAGRRAATVEADEEEAAEIEGDEEE